MDCLKNISTADVTDAIRSAKSRIVFVAPGIDEPTAAELSSAWSRLGPEAVTVILDVHAEVMRLGYGTDVGLAKIQDAAAGFGQAVCHQPGVRICIVVADEHSLIFTPTPLLIDGGSTQPDRPNGIALKATPKVLADELGIGEEGHGKREIGMRIVRAAEIEAVQKDLADNPPLKFSISQKEHVFNARLEFVEFELEGCMISQHMVTIPPQLVGMAKMDAQTRNKLRSSFRLIGKDDVIDSKKKVSEQALRDECLRIRRKYLRSIKNHGVLILRANRQHFEAEVETLRGKVAIFSAALGEKLAGLYEGNANRLTKAFLPAVCKKPPEEWVGALGLSPDRDAVARMLHGALLDAFGPPEDLLREMRVKLNFKGVTYATLVNDDFAKAASAEFPGLKLHDEYDAARGTKTPPTAQDELQLS